MMGDDGRRLVFVRLYSGTLTAGMTVIDNRDLKEVPEPNCDLQVGLDADDAWQVVVEAVAHFSR